MLTREQENKRTRGQAYEAVVVAWEKLGVASSMLEATQLVELMLPITMITAQSANFPTGCHREQ